MAEAKFFAPADMGEAFQLLGEYGGQLTVLAGGTDLVPKFNYYEVKPEAIMYIGNLGLDYIKSENGALTIGAGARTADLAASRAVQEKAPALARAARACRVTADGEGCQHLRPTAHRGRPQRLSPA